MQSEPAVETKSGLTTITAKPNVDDHVFIRLDTDDRPTLSIDVANKHGRRTLSVRVNGMTVASILCDVGQLPPAGHRIDRFCPYCGQLRNILASVDRHVCPETHIPLAPASEIENVFIEALGDIADVTMRLTVPSRQWTDEAVIDYVKNRVHKALEAAADFRHLEERRV